MVDKSHMAEFAGGIIAYHYYKHKKKDEYNKLKEKKDFSQDLATLAQSYENYHVLTNQNIKICKLWDETKYIHFMKLNGYDIKNNSQFKLRAVIAPTYYQMNNHDKKDLLELREYYAIKAEDFLSRALPGKLNGRWNIRNREEVWHKYVGMYE